MVRSLRARISRENRAMSSRINGWVFRSFERLFISITSFANQFDNNSMQSLVCHWNERQIYRYNRYLCQKSIKLVDNYRSVGRSPINFFWVRLKTSTLFMASMIVEWYPKYIPIFRLILLIIICHSMQDKEKSEWRLCTELIAVGNQNAFPLKGKPFLIFKFYSYVESYISYGKVIIHRSGVASGLVVGGHVVMLLILCLRSREILVDQRSEDWVSTAFENWRLHWCRFYERNRKRNNILSSHSVLWYEKRFVLRVVGRVRHSVMELYYRRKTCYALLIKA